MGDIFHKNLQPVTAIVNFRRSCKYPKGDANIPKEVANILLRLAYIYFCTVALLTPMYPFRL
jgi:hypothetical protein